MIERGEFTYGIPIAVDSTFELRLGTSARGLEGTFYTLDARPRTGTLPRRGPIDAPRLWAPPGDSWASLGIENQVIPGPRNQESRIFRESESRIMSVTGLNTL